MRGSTDFDNVRNENDYNTTSHEWKDGQKGENTKLNSERSEYPITAFTVIRAFWIFWTIRKTIKSIFDKLSKIELLCVSRGLLWFYDLFINIIFFPICVTKHINMDRASTLATWNKRVVRRKREKNQYLILCAVFQFISYKYYFIYFHTIEFDSNYCSITFLYSDR